MKPQSRTEWTVLGAVSLVSVVLLVVQLKHNGWGVDGWIVGLLGIGTLPWFWRVFESVNFPGGGGVVIRELERKQESQESDIRAIIEYLTTHLINDEQKRVLRRFGVAEPFHFIKGQPNYLKTMRAVGDLGRSGFIENRDGTPFNDSVSPLQDTGEGDLKMEYRITDRGREYLALLDKFR